MEKYYTDKDIKLEDVDFHWIGNEIGDVCGIGDEFWHVNDMVQVLKFKPTYSQLMDWYYNYWTNKEAETQYNIKSYMGLRIYQLNK